MSGAVLTEEAMAAVLDMLARQADAAELRAARAERELDALRSEVNIDRLTERAIDEALRRTNGSVAKAATLLGMGRATLYRRLAAKTEVDAIAAKIKADPVALAEVRSALADEHGDGDLCGDPLCQGCHDLRAISAVGGDE